MCCLGHPIHLTQTFNAKDGMELKSRGVPHAFKTGHKFLCKHRNICFVFVKTSVKFVLYSSWFLWYFCHCLFCFFNIIFSHTAAEVAFYSLSLELQNFLIQQYQNSFSEKSEIIHLQYTVVVAVFILLPSLPYKGNAVF